MQNNQLENARKILQHGVKKHAISTAMLANLARVYIMENKRQPAAELIQKIDELSPNNSYTPTLKAMLSANSTKPN